MPRTLIERPRGSSRATIGVTLSHYRIREKLGGGSMGEIYVAEDTTLHRRVALKVLPPALAGDPEYVRRFQREARAIAALNHPNIVTIHSVEKADGLHFLTMELVEGKTLAEVIPASGLPLHRFFALAVPLVEAVTAAHELGIVHRDLKPANVMVTADGRVKVLDFGLAKFRPEARAEAPEDASTEDLTAEGWLVGTLPYMSPEQLCGETADQRSDIFALGIILFELLTGERPFPGKSWGALMDFLLSDDPPPIGELPPDCPRQLRRIIGHCLRKDPKERYQSAHDLRYEMRELAGEWLAGRPVAAGPPAAPIRRRSLARYLAAATGVAVLALAATLFFPSDPPPGRTAFEPGAQKRIVVLPFENLGPSEDGYFAAGITDELSSRLTAAGGVRVISRNSALQYENTNKTTQEIGEELGVDYILAGTVRWERSAGAGRVRVTPRLVRVADDAQIWSQSYDRVFADVFEVQSEITEEVIRQLDVKLFAAERRGAQERPTENLAAYRAYLRGLGYMKRLGYEADDLHRAVEMLAQAVTLDPDFALAYAELAEAHAALYHLGHDRSAERRDQAVRAAERARSLAPDAPETHRADGILHFQIDRDWDRALDALMVALHRRPGDTRALYAKARIERRRGRFEQALTDLEALREIDPRDPRLELEIANTAMFFRHYAKAERHYDRAIELAPNRMFPYAMKCMCYLLWQGTTAEARATADAMPEADEDFSVYVRFLLELFDRRYPGALTLLSQTPVEYFHTNSLLYPASLLAAQVHELAGEPHLARDRYDAARRWLEAELEASLDDPRLHAALGLAYAGLGRGDDAVREGQRALQILPVAKDAWDGQYLLFDMALIYTMTGAYGDALEQIEYALSIPSALSVPWLELDPRWEPLRAHPRYRELVQHARPSDL